MSGLALLATGKFNEAKPLLGAVVGVNIEGLSVGEMFQRMPSKMIGVSDNAFSLFAFILLFFFFHAGVMMRLWMKPHLRLMKPSTPVLDKPEVAEVKSCGGRGTRRNPRP